MVQSEKEMMGYVLAISLGRYQTAKKKKKELMKLSFESLPKQNKQHCRTWRFNRTLSIVEHASHLFLRQRTYNSF